MKVHPNAKINLGLNVTERRPDGYHNIETVFYPIPLCDTLLVEATDHTDEYTIRKHMQEVFPEGTDIHTEQCPEYILHTGGIAVDCPPEKNLIIKALRDLQRDFTLPHLIIYMYKRIPSGAGLGGGSSDAAGMMKALNAEFRLGLSDDELETRVSALGADCAFFVRNRVTFASGIGNVFSPIGLSLEGWYLVLVKPDVFVSTKEAYSLIRPHRPKVPVTELITRPVETWKDTLCNDFEEGIFRLHPEIRTVKERLYAQGAAYAAMSGSGSSVFGLFRTPPSEPEQIFPGAFCTCCRL